MSVELAILRAFCLDKQDFNNFYPYTQQLKKKDRLIAMCFQLLHEYYDKYSNAFDLERDDKVLEGDSNTLKKFGITTTELKALSESKYGDIILEKVAMVDVIK